MLEDAVPSEEVTDASGKTDSVGESARDEAPVRATHEFVDELVLPVEIEDFDNLNEWFDSFDADICIPNEGFIKYEISSDGLVVLLLARERAHVLDLIRAFVASHH